MNNILFMHPAVHSIEDMFKYLYISDSRLAENLIWNQTNPDIVFVAEVIFTIPEYFNQFKKLYGKSNNKIYVLHGGESVYPDLNIFDYGLVYCTYLSEFDRVIKTPEQSFFLHKNEGFINKYDYKTALQSLHDRKFCNFIYSNPFSHPNRDAFFHELCRYKKVSSLGEHFNNTKTVPSRSHANWFQESITLKSKYKFSIAFENERYYGYTTEKILSSFQAHTVPIYWGNPNINDYYNRDAFINCHNYNGFDEVIERIKEIDNNDELWASIVSQPWQTEEQRERTKKDVKTYNSFFSDLFMADDLSKFVRRPMGTFTDLYYKWFFRAFQNNYLEKAKTKIARVFKETTYMREV